MQNQNDQSKPESGSQRRGFRARSPTLRALRALELLSGASMSASDLAQLMRVNRSTSLRLLQELEAGQYVSRDPHTKQYSGLFFLVPALRDHADWGEVIDPLLAHVRDEFHEATMFAVPANGAMVYMAFFPSLHRVAVREQLGTLRPMHASALGKAYLSAHDSTRLDEELARLTFEDGTAIAAKGPIELRQRLEEVVALGYAVDREETFQGVTCVAVPIRINRSLIGAMGVSGPSDRLQEDRIAQIGGRLNELKASLDRPTGLR